MIIYKYSIIVLEIYIIIQHSNIYILCVDKLLDIKEGFYILTKLPCSREQFNCIWLWKTHWIV